MRSVFDPGGKSFLLLLKELQNDRIINIGTAFCVILASEFWHLILRNF